MSCPAKEIFFRRSKSEHNWRKNNFRVADVSSLPIAWNPTPRATWDLEVLRLIAPPEKLAIFGATAENFLIQFLTFSLLSGAILSNTSCSLQFSTGNINYRHRGSLFKDFFVGYQVIAANTWYVYWFDASGETVIQSGSLKIPDSDHPFYVDLLPANNKVLLPKFASFNSYFWQHRALLDFYYFTHASPWRGPLLRPRPHERKKYTIFKKIAQFLRKSRNFS